MSPAIDIHLADNLAFARQEPDAGYDLVYLDPPFNTGRRQSRTRIAVRRDPEGDRTGFGGRRYRTVRLGTLAFDDVFDDYLAFLEPRLRAAWRLLKPDGSLFVHLDPREVHYVKVLLDAICGRERFMNEIVWAYDFGARSRRRWSPKHDLILWYVRDPRRYTFRYEAIDRIPYRAPELAGPEKATRGKTPTDVWWHTIVPTRGRERTGYPTQKPLGVVGRIVRVHAEPGARLLDLFAGSGTLGEAAARHGCSAVLVDHAPEACAVMARRLAPWGPRCHGFAPRTGPGP